MKFFWVKETGGDAVFLMDEGSLKYYEKVREADDATAQNFAEYCDQEAENANHHGMVGAHARLVEIMQEAGISEKLCAATMHEIAAAGGLHELVM